MKLRQILKEMINQISSFEDFKATYPIIKNLNSLRTKGVQMEDIAATIQDAFKLDRIGQGGMRHQYWDCYGNNSIGTFEKNGTSGIPQVYVGVKNTQTYQEVLSKLQGMVRTTRK